MVLEIALIDGLAWSMTLFLVSLGLSLIFGLEHIANFAHGSIFMLGAFIGYETFVRTGNFFYGLVAASVSMGILGFLIEIGLLRRFLGREFVQVMITIGLFEIIDQICWIFWGEIVYYWMPEPLSGTVTLAGTIFYKYRLFLILVGFAIAGAMYLFLTRTKFGIIIRAGLDDIEIAEAMGVNVKNAFTIVFAIGLSLIHI